MSELKSYLFKSLISIGSLSVSATDLTCMYTCVIGLRLGFDVPWDNAFCLAH